jgi:superfamily II DNA/RNA helicase
MTDFSQLGLSAETIKTIAETGYTVPTPIQEQAIPVALAGRDVLGIAQTGTGKTAAFTLPMIDRLAAGRARARMPRSLVLCPTRELADQVAAAFDKYAKGQKLTWALLIGGVSFSDQEKKLDRGVDVLIATPGRLLDHFERGKLLLTGVQIMVVDEADRMLDMGFIPDIERIFKLTPPSRQTLFFSATMPPEITRLTAQFLKDPTRIEATRPAMTADTITQKVVNIPTNDPKAKRMALRALIEGGDVVNGIVFCNRKTDVDIVAKSLAKHGVDALPIHGDLDQATRMRTLASFRDGGLKILVASDVAARGLDVPAVSHVFNYDVPFHAEDYVHRIGRTGRAGRLGEAFMIVTPADGKTYDKVIKLTQKEPEFVTLDLDWSSVESDGERSRGGRGERSERSRPSGRGAPREDREAASSEGSPRDAAPRDASPREASPREAGPRDTASRAPASTGGRRSRRLHPRRVEAETAVETTVAPIAYVEPDAFEPQVIEAQPDVIETVARSPRRERSRSEPRTRPTAPALVSEPAAAPVAQAGYGQREPRRTSSPASDTRGGSREDRDSAVVGFGQDVPAFLLRAAPVFPLASDAATED